MLITGEQVAFPVTGNSPVLCLGGPLPDRDGIDDLALATICALRGTRPPDRACPAQVCHELGKTHASRRQVPLSRRALAALELLPARLDTPLLFPSPAGGLLNLDNFRRREWAPAVEAAGIALPARIYDLRSTFASNALAAGITVFELARIMGTSVRMIERHYGALLDGAHAGLSGRLDAVELQLEQAAAATAAEDVR